jgi:DNA topoisomerase I
MSARDADHPAAPDPTETAEAAGLRYVSDEDPGICRKPCGRGFTYRDARGKTIRDRELRERLEDLAIPPAWRDVWICPHEDGHLQVTGRDEEGRKQYLYHPRWRRTRDRIKYARLEKLGARLPQLRQRVGRHLDGAGLERERVVAGAVRLLDRAALRLGSEAYTEENDSFGITTLRKEHVEKRGARMRFRFEAKSGQERDVVVRDERLARLVGDLLRVDDERLFVFENGNETHRTLSNLRPEHVNAYLRDAFQGEITAKDFRTWTGSVAVLLELERALDRSEDERDAAVVEAIDAAAELLGNRRPTARDFYVHPGLLDAYGGGELEALIRGASLPRRRPGFRTGERLLLALLPRLEVSEEE